MCVCVCVIVSEQDYHVLFIHLHPIPANKYCKNSYGVLFRKKSPKCLLLLYLDNNLRAQKILQYHNIIALIFRGSKFLQFLRIQCHSRKYYFNEKFDTLHHQLLLQHIHEFFSMKLSKTAIIRKNFDLRNISTIRSTDRATDVLMLLVDVSGLICGKIFQPLKPHHCILCTIGSTCKVVASWHQHWLLLDCWNMPCGVQ